MSNNPCILLIKIGIRVFVLLPYPIPKLPILFKGVRIGDVVISPKADLVGIIF